MKVLVTGGAGYIGSHAVKLLLEKKYQVVVIDNLFRGYQEVIEVLQKKFTPQKLIFYQADLKDFPKIDQIFKKEKPEAVIHFAALCLPDESMVKPEIYFENNALATLNLLKAMVKNKTKDLVFSSSSCVYGESQYLPVDEKHPLNPINPYGESKVMAEKIINWYGQIYQIRYTILRYFNVSGAASDGLIGDSKKPSQLLVQCAVRGALGIEPFKLTCPEVDTKDKTPIRDYVNVEDLVEAHLAALKYLDQGGQSEIFNLGTSKGNSVLEIVNQVKKITGKEFVIGKGRVRPGEHAVIYANIKKAKKLLNWQPKRTIRDSVKSLVLWYQNHPQGWNY